MTGMSSSSVKPYDDVAARNAWLRQACADVSMALTGAGIVGLFAISALLLEHYGIAYISSGGGVTSKFHPSTMLLILALILRCLSSRHPFVAGWRLVSDDPGVVILATAVVITIFYAALISKTPVTGLVDTFVLPILVFLALRDLHPALRRWIAMVVIIVFAINAAMAIYEFINQSHIIQLGQFDSFSADPTRADATFDWRAELALDWRATALLGHPLVNGLIVCSMITCLVVPGSRWMPMAIKAPLLAVQCLSMFAFGARTSLTFTILICAFALCHYGYKTWRGGVRLKVGHLAIVFALIGLATLAAGADLGTSFFDRTLERFSSDAGSANARFTMLELFGPLSWSDIMLGPNQEVVATLQRMYGLEFGIESSEIGLALTYGVLVTSFLVIGVIAFSRSVVRVSGRGSLLVLIPFYISISGTASLSGKTTSLAMAVALIMVFLDKDERRLQFNLEAWR